MFTQIRLGCRGDLRTSSANELEFLSELSLRIPHLKDNVIIVIVIITCVGLSRAFIRFMLEAEDAQTEAEVSSQRSISLHKASLAALRPRFEQTQSCAVRRAEIQKME